MSWMCWRITSGENVRVCPRDEGRRAAPWAPPAGILWGFTFLLDVPQLLKDGGATFGKGEREVESEPLAAQEHPFSSRRVAGRRRKQRQQSMLQSGMRWERWKSPRLKSELVSEAFSPSHCVRRVSPVVKAHVMRC